MKEKIRFSIIFVSLILVMTLSFVVSAANDAGKITISKTATKADSREANVSLHIGSKSLEETTADVVLVLDRSTSMDTAVDNSNRMEVTKTAATNLINSLMPDATSTNVRIGLVTFGSDLLNRYSSRNLTNIKQTITSTISSIPTTAWNQGTNVQAGLEEAKGLLEDSTADRKIVILLSDGGPTFFNYDGEICGSGSDDDLGIFESWGCRNSGYIPSTAAKAEADALKDMRIGAEIYTIGFGLDDEEAVDFLANQIATSSKHYYSVSDTTGLETAMQDIASQVSGVVALNAVVTDIIPEGFTITEESKQTLINQYGAENISFETTADNKTIIKVKFNQINSRKAGGYSIDYTVVADEDHYGSMYTNESATLTATPSKTNSYYDGEINLTFDKPAVPIAMHTNDDDYTSTEVKEGESLTIPANGILGNDSLIKHEDVQTGATNVNVTNEIIPGEPTCGTVNVNSDGSFTYNADSSCAGTVTFDYYVKTTVDVDGVKQEVYSNTSTVTLKVVENATSYQVKYLEENTNKELASSVTKDGNVFDEVTENAIDIDGYEIVGEDSKKLELTTNVGTNVIIFYYRRATAEVKEPTITKEGPASITATDQVVDYEINYSTEIDKYIGKATITIVDTLPFEIDEAKSNLDGGIYNKDSKTITWVEEYDVNTYESNNNSISITKNITVSYIYGEFNGTEQSVMNQVTGTTHVETATDKEATDTEYTPFDVKGTLVERHVYINALDEEVSLIPDVTTNKKIGTSYSTSVKDIDGFEVVSVPDNANGKYIEGTTTVTYVYERVEAKITDSEVTKTSKTHEVTKVDDEVTYHVNYQATISDYIGDAVVTVVDTLPFEINEAKSNLDGGVYNSTDKTITWTFEVKNINTYTNGAKVINLPIEYTVVYTNLDATLDNMTNSVHATITVDTTTPNEVEDEIETPINVNGKVIAKYVDTEGVELKTQIETTGKVGTNYETNALDVDGYTLKEVDGSESGRYTVNDITVTYIYERNGATGDESVLTKTGTTEIKASNEEVNYTINYANNITDYFGDLTLTLVDTLPYEIDEAKSNLDGGIYNKDSKTITWTFEYNVLDASEIFEINETKNITVVYKNVDATSSSFINNLKANLEDELNNNVDEKTTSHENNVNINGTVITKYVDQNDNMIAQNETSTGKVGTNYTTSAKEIDGYENPVVITNNANGLYQEGTITVIYKYDRVKAEITEDEISKDSNVTEITSSNSLVDYQISYTGKIDKYIGDATITLVDTLPYEIDEAKSNLDGGIYDKDSKTITWVVTVNNINTYLDGTYNISIQENIVVSYVGVIANKDIVNNIKGEVNLDTASSTPIEDEETVKAEIKGNVNVTYVYIDKDGVEHVIAEPSKLTGYVGDNYTTSAKAINGYKVVDSKPENYAGKYIEGDINVKYVYDRLPAIIEENNVDKVSNNDVITSIKDAFDYTINYVTTIKDYIGKAVVTIIDYLSFEIDENASYLDGGIYDKDSKTITWLDSFDINTYEGNNKIDITKNIKLVYLNLDASAREVTNKVATKLNLETAPEVTTEDETSTRFEVSGKIVIKFVDEEGNTLSDDVIINGLVGDKYITASKDIFGYHLLKVIGEETGEFIDGELVVTYVYEKTPMGSTNVLPPKTGVNGNTNYLPITVILFGLLLVSKKKFI